MNRSDRKSQLSMRKGAAGARVNEALDEGSDPRPPSAPMVARDGVRPIRVMLVDDHDIMREGLAALIRAAEDIELVAEASDGVDAIEKVGMAAPDVVVMDVSMPRMDGVEATRWISKNCPHVRVIGLSMHSKADFAENFIEAGGAAFLTKGGPSEELIKAIREA